MSPGCCVKGSSRAALEISSACCQRSAHDPRCGRARRSHGGVSRRHRTHRRTSGQPWIEFEGKQELAVLRNILRAFGDEVPFSLLAGERYHLTSHGMLGFALLSSPSVGHVIDFAANHCELSYTFNHCDVTVERGQLRLTHRANTIQRICRDYLVDRDLAAAVTFGRDP